MEKININSLGTSSSVPTKIRNHTSILISFRDENILIDCGEGTQRQFRIGKINPLKLTKLFITHWHGDHVLGIPGLLQTLALNNYNKTLEIYGPKKTQENISQLTNIFNEFRIKYKIKEISDSEIDFGYYKISSKPMNHNISSNAYSIKIKDKLRIDKKKLKKLNLKDFKILKEIQNGKDIKINNKKISYKSLTYLEKGKKITIILDTLMNNNALDLAKESDILIAESSFSKEDREKAKDHFHLTSEEAGIIAKKSKSKKLILTHISERYENNLSNLEKSCKKIFPNTAIAKDHMQITL